jgi:hypothetical protein
MNKKKTEAPAVTEAHTALPLAWAGDANGHGSRDGQSCRVLNGIAGGIPVSASLWDNGDVELMIGSDPLTFEDGIFLRWGRKRG